jgi:uncharacterized protein involved in oxidation of intracellular sulfur
MATILYFATYGSDDPTRATIPFFTAKGAIEAGHQPQIVLAGEATYLMHDYVAEQVQGMGVPPVKELIAFVVAHGVPVYV